MLRLRIATPRAVLVGLSVLVLQGIGMAAPPGAAAASVDAVIHSAPEDVLSALHSDAAARMHGGFRVEAGASAPQRSFWFVVPAGHRVDALRTKVLTRQDVDNEVAATVDKATASTQLARVVGRGDWLGWQLVNVRLSPLQWQGDRLTVATDVAIELQTSAGERLPLQRQRQNRRMQERDAADVRRIVANPKDVSLFAPPPGKAVAHEGGFQASGYPDLEGSDVEYLIVTPAALANSFQVLADWKTRRGVPTVVRTLEDIQAQTRQGSDVQETLRNYLQDAYANWSLQYVLLGGDTDLLPARYVSSKFGLSTPEEIPCDLYFAGLDGNWNADGDGLWGEAGATSGSPDIDAADLLAEVNLSRATVTTTADVDLFVQKVIGYETPLDATYQDRTLFLAEVLFPTNYDGTQNITTDGAQLSDDLINSVLPPGTPVQRRYENDEGYPGSLPLGLSISLQELDFGYNLVNHMGHGFRYNMSVGDGSIVNGDAEALQNTNRFSIINVLNCTSLAFDYSCLAEHYLSNPVGGAVAVLGASRSAYPLPSREYQDEFYNLLFNQNESKLGRLFSMSRLPQTPLADYDSAHRWTHYIYNILGDPEMQVFSDLPDTLLVSTDPSAVLGDNQLTVTVTDELAVPVQQAQVCLQKGEDDYQVGWTDANGSVTLPFRAESAGEIDVTVSGNNLRTHLGSIPVIPSGDAYVHFESLSLDDGAGAGTVGNSDGLIDAGETIDLLLSVRNDGGAVVDTLLGTATVNDPYVSVVTAGFMATNVGVSSSAVAAAPIRLQVSPSAPDGHVFQVDLDLAGASAQWQDQLRRTVHAPQLEVVGQQYLDQQLGNGNGLPDEDETFDLVVEVKNFGSGAVDGITATLQSTQHFIVQVVQGSSNFGSIASFGTAQNSPEFRLKTYFVDDTTVDLRLTDSYGRLVVLPIHALHPQAPAAAPTLDPSTAPTIVLLTWPPVADPDLRGYHVYRSEATNGPWTRVTTDPTPVSYFRDTGLASSTKYWYYTTAIDEAGNESANSAMASVSTNPPQLEGWPIAMVQETASSPAVGDLDGDGKMEIVQGNLKVYAWHALDGQEILDADGNAQTWGVFLDESGTTTASVALGELDGTPGLEVVSCDWDDNKLFAVDGDGTVLWTVSPSNGGVVGYWGTPTLSDVDRDGWDEVLALSKDGHLYAWNHDGTPLLSQNADGTFAVTAAWSRSSPAVGNLDGDIELEIVLTDVTGKLHAWDVDGTPLPNFPLSWGYAFYNSPVLGDVDGDGDLEIVAFSQSGSNNLHVLHADGTELPGWPITVTSKSPAVTPSPALADLDGDGRLEIIVVSNEIVTSTSTLRIFQWDGSVHPGWPKVIGSDTESSPVVADLDGDASPDVLLGGQNGVLQAWSSAGVELVGFPLSVGDFIRATPTVDDVDGDGDVDVVFAGWDRTVYIWDLPATWHPEQSWWPSFLHDASRTGRWDGAPTDATDATGEDGIASPPRALELAQNHPNPFNPTTTIAFGIPGTVAQPVHLAIFDVRGRQVRRLLDASVPPGRHQVIWDGRDDAGRSLASGVYFYRLQWQSEAVTRRLVLMK
jgi:hypothetical protein